MLKKGDNKKVLHFVVSNVLVEHFNSFPYLAWVQQYFILYHGGQFYCWSKWEYTKMTNKLLQVTDKHCHITYTWLLDVKYELSFHGNRHQLYTIGIVFTDGCIKYNLAI